MRFQTKAIHAGQRPDPATGAIVTPIHQSATYAFDDVDKNKGYDYSRSGNPTRKALEEQLAALEGGTYCVALTTGMAAETTVTNLFKRGDHIICGNDVYGGTFRLFKYIERQFEVAFSFISLVDPARILAEVRPNTKAVWVETPSNPLFNVVDLEVVANIAAAHNLLTIVDNTLLSPYCQQPLRFGADIVVHSTTKYLSGHNDGLGGAIICNDAALAEQIAFCANALGTVSSAFDAWLILRGVKTLTLRMREHQKNALRLARFLQNHPKVKRVYYPGLPDHPQARIIEKQTTGFGGMLSFEVEGGKPAAHTLLRCTQLFYIAESFGGAESLIEHPATMSHASMSSEAQAEAGITDGLLRISAGLEDSDDLLDDLQQAFDKLEEVKLSAAVPA